jgi:hypothetical protein
VQSDRWDETWHRLKEWTNGQAQSERLAAQILISEGFKGLDPSHPLGGPDGGRDAICTYNEDTWVMAVYFPRGSKKMSDIKVKLREDVFAASKHNPVGVAFVTNQELKIAQRQQLQKIASPCRLEVFHLERITLILDSPQMAGVRKQFLGIESVDSVPVLEVQFYEPGSRKQLGTIIKLQSIAYGIPQHRISSLEIPRSTLYGGITPPIGITEALNPSYMRDKEQYIRAKELLQKVFLGIRNSSTRLAEEVTLEIEGSLDQGIEIAEDLPQKPVRQLINKIPDIRPLRRNSYMTPNVERFGDEFRITIKFGTIPPGHISIMEVPVFLGSRESTKLLMNAQVVSNNLPLPIEFCLQVDFDITPKPPLDINFLRQ